MKRSSRRRRIALLCAGAVLAASAAVMGGYGVAAAQAWSGYDAAGSRLGADLDRAFAAGYAASDLVTVLDARQHIEAQPAPVWIGRRPDFYNHMASRLDGLRTSLRTVEAAALAEDRHQAQAALTGAQTKVGDAQAVGVDPADLTPLTSSSEALAAAEGAAAEPKDYGAVVQRAQALLAKASGLAQAQEAEVAAIESSAQQLVSRYQGDPAKIRGAGQAALAAGNNDATIAAYTGSTSTDRHYHSLGHYGSLLGSTDLTQLSIAAAGTIRYSQLIHQDLTGSLPSRVIIISHQAQELWAYQGGKLVLDSLVTTGRPQLPTDIGPMRVLSKSSPWTMRSPWPKTSPWYYPPTVVQMVLWFTDTGEGLHDASWEWSNQYGPGSETGPAASHGCIHVPYNNEVFLFRWAPVGTPVIVFPGDGSSVAGQMSQITVDSNGQPLTGPKGA